MPREPMTTVATAVITTANRNSQSDMPPPEIAVNLVYLGFEPAPLWSLSQRLYPPSQAGTISDRYILLFYL